MRTSSRVILIVGAFVLTSLFVSQRSSIEYYTDDNNNKNSDIQTKPIVKTSSTLGKVHIIGNQGWSNFKIGGGCTGEGTLFNPYVLNNLDVNGTGYESAILIEGSTVFFVIENSTFFNSGLNGAGVTLKNTQNGKLINNTFSNNYNGIYLFQSGSNTIIDNNISNNIEFGINLVFSDYNTISRNRASTNYRGIEIQFSHNNLISHNTANLNRYIGYYLGYSDNNVLTENSALKNAVDGIHILDSDNNIFSGNQFVYNLNNGVNMWLSRDNLFAENMLSFNFDRGVYIDNQWGSGTDNVFYNNSFEGNRINVVDRDANNVWNNSIVGNYFIILLIFLFIKFSFFLILWSYT